MGMPAGGTGGTPKRPGAATTPGAPRTGRAPTGETPGEGTTPAAPGEGTTLAAPGEGTTLAAPGEGATPTAPGARAAPPDRATGGAVLGGLGAAVAVGVVWAVLAVGLDFHLGLLVVAGVGGWVIGATVQRTAPGAWPVAVVLAVLAWLIAAGLSYLLSQVLLPESVTPLAERLSLTGLINYTTQTFDLVQAGAIAILVIAAWRSAR